MDQGERQRWIDKLIQQAQQEGLFDNLAGVGRPINWEDESLVNKDWLMAFRLMREHGFAPEWIELHKEIGKELAKTRETVLRAWHWRQERLPDAGWEQRRYIDAEWQRARTAFAEAIAELNARITDFNLIVPIAHLQKFKLDVDQELSSLGIDA